MNQEESCRVENPLPAVGVGGCIDDTGQLVKESRIDTAYGEVYPVSDNQFEYVPETVIYIPIIPKHWGHFLIDAVCRFWFVGDSSLDNYRIAYCGWNWGEDDISGNYLQMLNLLEISEERLLFIRKPTRFDTVLIPSATFGFRIDFRSEYTGIIGRAVDNALQSEQAKKLSPKEKIYFTRTAFHKASKNEVGEKEIEDLFRMNGFEVLAPERLSLIEQIFYIHNCDVMASMSGTAAHNIMFGSAETKQIIINRVCFPNLPQIRIDECFDVEYIYIDAYNRWSERHPRNYGDGPVWIEINENVRRYAEDNNWAIPDVSAATKVKNLARFRWLTVVRSLRRNKILKTGVRRLKKILKK